MYGGNMKGRTCRTCYYWHETDAWDIHSTKYSGSSSKNEYTWFLRKKKSKPGMSCYASHPPKPIENNVSFACKNYESQNERVLREGNDDNT